MLVVIIFGIVGIAYAIKVANFNPIALNVTSAPIDVNITYDSSANGASITSSDKMVPIDDSLITGVNVTDERVIKAKFNVAGVSSNPDNTIYDVALRDINIDCDLRTEDVKWRLYKNGTLLTSGNLSPTFDVMSDNRLVLTDTQQDLTTTTDEYVFLLWISESCTGDISTCSKEQEQNKYLNKSFSASIKLEMSTKAKKTLVRNTASLNSCSFSTTSVPAFNSLTYDGLEQTLINTGTGYTLVNNTGTNAGEYVVTAKLDNGYKWSDGTTNDKVIKGKINKKKATIVASDQSISYGSSIDSTKYTVIGLLTGHSASSVFLDSSTVDKGVGTITPTSARIVDSKGNDVTDNYILSYVSGTLRIDCSSSSSINVSLPSTLTYGTSGTYTYTVSPAKLLVSCTSSDTSIATCSVDTTNKTVTITPKGIGSVNITLNGKVPNSNDECSSVSTSKAITVNCSNTATEPIVTSSQDYTGSIRIGVSGGANVDLGGTLSATNAGTYTGTATPSKGYCWSDNTTSTKSYSWTINKASSTCTISSTPTLKYPSSTTGTFSYSCTGDGSLSLANSNPSVISFGTVGTTSTTLTAKAIGSSTITLKQSEGTNYLASSPVTKSITVSASTYTLTYDNNGGSGCTSKTVTYGSNYGTMCTPTREGYIFVGWFDSSYKDAPLNYYADTYSDLYNAFGYDTVGLYNHYLTYGQNEGRRLSQYISTDTYNTSDNKTLYAGWVKFNYYRKQTDPLESSSSTCKDGYYNKLVDAVCPGAEVTVLNNVTESSDVTLTNYGSHAFFDDINIKLNNHIITVPSITFNALSDNGEAEAVITGPGKITYSSNVADDNSYLIRVLNGTLYIDGGSYITDAVYATIKVESTGALRLSDKSSRLVIEANKTNANLPMCTCAINSSNTGEMVVKSKYNGMYIYSICYTIWHDGVLRVQSHYPSDNNIGVEMTVISTFGDAIVKNKGDVQVGNYLCSTRDGCTSDEISSGKMGHYGYGTEMYPYLASYSSTTNSSLFPVVYNASDTQFWFYSGRMVTDKTNLTGCTTYQAGGHDCAQYFGWPIYAPDNYSGMKYSSVSNEVNSRGDNINGTKIMLYT